MTSGLASRNEVRIGGSTSTPTISLAVTRMEPPSELARPEASRTAADAAADMSCR